LRSLISEIPGTATLPQTDPTNGGTWYVPAAYARMLGDPNATTGGQTDPNIKTQSGQNPPIFDSVVTLSTAYDDPAVADTWAYGQDVINGVIHELSEGILGRTGFGVWTGAFSTMDLFRYALADSQHPTPWLDTKNGTDGITTYFSSDGGKTLSSVPFNNQYTSPTSASNEGDAADWPNTAPNAYWVFGNTNARETFTLDQTELNIVQALGWNVSLPQAVFTAASDSWETPPAWEGSHRRRHRHGHLFRFRQCCEPVEYL
jgi:hypothetical protein